MSDLSYPIVIEKLDEADGGGYAAYALDLYGCMSDGETYEEAAKNIQSAILEWCDEMTRLGREIPAPGSVVQKARVQSEELVDLTKELFKVLKKQETVLKRQKSLLAAKAQEATALEQSVNELKRKIEDLSAKETEQDHEGHDWLRRIGSMHAFGRRAEKNGRVPH